MCGIVGIVDFQSQVDPQRLSNAAETLRLRGPDDAGIWTNENVGLAHRRLSIIDLSPAAHQPMFSADQRYAIVYNGEIYNFLELREELKHSGWSSQSSSDTEVILAAYEKWGAGCVERFHGMFAFAIWDRLARVLYAARDRMGEKPFYYHFSHDCFAFASRPRALLALNSQWANPLDEQALRFYFESGYVPAPYSIFRAIRKLPPAHWLLLTDAGIHLQRYWDFRQIPPQSSWENRREEYLLDELDELLSKSVRARMISDVPLGAFLSGGIDSSLVVAMMARHSARTVKTFTIGFEDNAFDESAHAATVAAHLKTDHLCEDLRVDDLLDLGPAFSNEFDEPFFDSSAFPAMAVSRLARQHVVVSLSGDGGDELFGGYSYYHWMRGLSLLYSLPPLVRKIAATLTAKLPYHRMKLLAGALRQNNIMDAFCFTRSIAKDFAAVLSPEVLQRTISLSELFAQAAQPFHRELKTQEMAMRLDMFYTLPDDYLQKVDISSMAFSLESRAPLLDHAVIEWAMKLPLKWKLRHGTNKYLLRQLAYRYIPKDMLDRPKQGFSVPIHDWLRGPLQIWAQAELTNAQNFENVPLNQACLLNLLQLHNSGTRQAHPLLWAALVFLDFMKNLPSQTSAQNIHTLSQAV